MFPDAFIYSNRPADARTALLCARLSLRIAKRRVQKGFLTAGITALYDAVFFGMRYYVAKDQQCASLARNADLWDAISLFQVLSRANVFDDPLTFNRFNLVVERALWQGPSSFDVNTVIAESEKMLTKLGVLSLPRSRLSGSSVLQ